jgi:hypothetical protein
VCSRKAFLECSKAMHDEDAVSVECICSQGCCCVVLGGEAVCSALKTVSHPLNSS